MRLSIICGYLLLAYMTYVAGRRLYALAIERRSRAWRAVVGLMGLGLGWTPATDGSAAGYVLIAAGGAASASLPTEAWRKIDDARAGRRCHNERRRAGATRPLDEPPEAALTELDQAAHHMTMLGSYVRRLERASDGDDIEVQQALADDVGAVAQRLHDALEVVVEERHRLAGRA
jgi:hypothetical protein